MLAIIGIGVALLVGLVEGLGMDTFAAYSGTIALILVVAGLLVGYFNVQGKESVPFMVAALVIAGGATFLALIPGIGVIVSGMASRLAEFAAPAALVVAVMTIWERAK